MLSRSKIFWLLSGLAYMTNSRLQHKMCLRQKTMCLSRVRACMHEARIIGMGCVTEHLTSHAVAGSFLARRASAEAAVVQALSELAELTATSDREQAANEAEWDTLTQLIEADRRQQARLCSFPGLYMHAECAAPPHRRLIVYWPLQLRTGTP